MGVPRLIRVNNLGDDYFAIRTDIISVLGRGHYFEAYDRSGIFYLDLNHYTSQVTDDRGFRAVW